MEDITTVGEMSPDIPGGEGPSSTNTDSETGNAMTNFLETGEQITVDLDGVLYIISAVMDESSGQVVNVMNLASETPEGTTNFDTLTYATTVVEDDGLSFEHNDVVHETVQDQNDANKTEKGPENDVARLEILPDNVETLPVPLVSRKQRPKKQRIRNKDIMRLPFTYPGQTFTVQAQKLILNVYHFFKQAEENPSLLRRLGGPQEAASQMLNVSNSVIGRIKNQFKSLGRVAPPKIRRNKVKKVLDRVDPAKENVIRDIIKETTNNGQLPTVKAVMTGAISRGAFKGSKTSFRRVLARMQLRYAKVDKRTVIIDPGHLSYS